MNVKPDSCKNCVLHNVGHGFVPDDSKDSQVSILALSPSKDDVQGRHLVGYAGKGQPIYETTTPKPFIGAAGWILDQTYLPAAGLTRDQVSIHHILKCYTPHPPTGDTLQSAMHHCIKAHLNITDESKVLVTMGKEPWELFQGSLPLTDWRGFQGPKKLGDGKCVVYATHHPKDLYGDPHLRFITRLDWKKIPSILKGEWPLEIPKQCIASPATRGEFIRLLEEALCQPEILVDTEYIPSNGLLTHVGAAWKLSSDMASKDGLLTSQKPIVRGFQLEWVRGAATSVERGIFMRFWPLLCKKVRMGFWNAKADLKILEENLHCIPDQIEDPMQAHSILWPDMPHDFEFVASIYGKYPKLKHLSKQDMLLYHWGDCIDLVWIWEQLKKEFQYEKKCEEKYRGQNLKLIPIILRREREGIKVNERRVKEAIPAYETLTQSSQILAQAYCGFPINLGSTGQLAQYLGSGEGLKLRSMDQDAVAVARSKYYPFDADKEDKEGFSIGYIHERVMQGAHPLLELRMMYAKNEKINNSYLGPLLGVGRVYPQINFHTQVTGRHSTTNPALATFPNNLRDTVMPDPGQAWIGWDWSQQEPRIQWGESGSQVLGRAFEKGEDIHTTFVCDLYGWGYPPDIRDPHHSPVNAAWRESHNWGGDTDPRRVFAKQVRYEINYDHTEKAYNAQQKAIRMGIEPGIAKKAAETLLNSDPELRQWFRQIMKEGEKTKITRSWGGGRRVYYWADGFSKMPLNEIRNFPLQAGGADLYNLTIVEICEKVKEASFVYGLHDSQWWSIPNDDRVMERARAIKQIVEQPRQIGGRMIPFPGTFKLMDEYGQVKKLDI